MAHDSTVRIAAPLAEVKPPMVAPRNGPGRPKDANKRAAILKAARKHFLAHGYNGASMDAIAADASVSKLTIYSHFTNKDALFQEVIAGECLNSSLNRDFDALAKLPAEDALKEVAMNVLKILLHPEMLNLHRLMVSQAAQQPKISRLYYEAGPEQFKETLAELLAVIAKRDGYFFGDDLHHTATLFCCCVKGDMHYRAVLNLQSRFTLAEMEAHASEIVGLFLRTHGAR
jgi:TetR/AcrR family transcriptional repressor of mexJK operon